MKLLLAAVMLFFPIYLSAENLRESLLSDLYKLEIDLNECVEEHNRIYEQTTQDRPDLKRYADHYAEGLGLTRDLIQIIQDLNGAQIENERDWFIGVSVGTHYWLIQCTSNLAKWQARISAYSIIINLPPLSADSIPQSFVQKISSHVERSGGS